MGQEAFDLYGRPTTRSIVHTSTARQNANKFPRGIWSDSFLACTGERSQDHSISEPLPLRYQCAALTYLVIECLCIMGLEAYIFYKFFRELNLQNSTARTVPTYLAIYICAFVFSLCISFTAVSKRNTLQVIGLVLFNVAFLAYSAVQLREAHNVIFGVNTDKTTDVFSQSSDMAMSSANHVQARIDFWHELLPYLIAVPCVIALAQVIYVLNAIKLHKIFGWDVYQKLGADRKVKAYFLAYQLLIVLLCYDWFFFGGFTVQLLILYVDTHNWEFWVTVAALPITLFGLLAAGYAVRHELKWLMLLFDLCLAAAMAYFCYKFWRIFGKASASMYQNDRITLAIFASISVVLLIMTFIISVICQSYFGKADLWNKRRAKQEVEDVTVNEMEFVELPFAKRTLLD